MQLKTGQCPDCVTNHIYTEKPLIAGRCQMHYKVYRSKISKDRRLVRGLQEPRKQTHFQQTTDLYDWFENRGKELTGVCAKCNGKSCKGDPKYQRFSIAHIFPKSQFQSVATHPMNFIELCFWGESCHTNYDNQGIESVIHTPAWIAMVERFNAFEDLLTPAEKGKHFYQVFKKYAQKIPANHTQY